MSTDKAPRHTPEERELAKKLAELTALETELAQRELDLHTLQAEVHAFEAQYLDIIGTRYATLDDLEAQIAAAVAWATPHDPHAHTQAAQARAHAQESAQATEGLHDGAPRTAFQPSEPLKTLYRMVAKCVHPDLTTDAQARVRRTVLMAEANRAYAAGDVSGLQAILDQWDSAPDIVEGTGVGAELIRVIRKIAQVEQRLRDIEVEMEQWLSSDLHQLKTRVEAATRDGRDVLAEMAAQLDQQIAAVQTRLDALKERRT
jgi:chromosome segregation ATPase